MAGPPCQHFSRLSQRPGGFDDPRSDLIYACKRGVEVVASVARKHKKPYRWLVEEVASMSAKHRDHISRIFGSEPVLVHSADFGHIHRAR
eukprot:12279803-Karenia_brevis.AAC.1